MCTVSRRAALVGERRGRSVSVVASRVRVPGTRAWQTHPVALVLTLRTPPAVIPTRSSNRLGSELIRSAVANQRRRGSLHAFGRVCRLTPAQARSKGPRPRPATPDALTPRWPTGRRLAQRAVKSTRRMATKNVAERIPRGGLPISHTAAAST